MLNIDNCLVLINVLGGINVFAVKIDWSWIYSPSTIWYFMLNIFLCRYFIYCKVKLVL